PAEKKNGLPVSTSAAKSARSSSSSVSASESIAARPKTVGFAQSSPLSIVTIAISPARRSLNCVSATEVLPEQRGAHAHADAQRGQAVPHLGPFAKAVCE